jgi:RNA polymerase sigma-70 factor (ECF subfamily)
MKPPDWEAILREHGPVVWRVCWRILTHRADVEECFQETFLAAVRVSRSAAVASWPALLHNLATARAIDRLRQRVTRRRVFAEQGTSEDVDTPMDRAQSPQAQPAEHAVAAELSDRLREALTALPEKQARAFCLHALDGWPHQQVAEHLGMSENAVAVTIHRARQRLKELLSDGSTGGLGRHSSKKERPSHVPAETVVVGGAARSGGVS